MCNPLAIAALAAGAGYQAYGQHQAAKASNNALENGMMRQRELQGNINDVVKTGATRDFQIGNMTDSYNNAANERTGALTDVLQQYGNGQESANTGDTSGEFGQAQAAQKIKQMEVASKLAALMGKAGAMGDAGQKRSIAMMGDSDTVAGIGQDMQRANQQTNWDMQKASHKGDNAKLIGSLLMLAGSQGVGGKTAVAKAPSFGGSGASANSMFGSMA
jgi:hypothetical protein